VAANVGEAFNLARGADGDIKVIAVGAGIRSKNGHGNKPGVFHEIGGVGGMQRDKLNFASLDRRNFVGAI
jgi:hypothetical protein